MMRTRLMQGVLGFTALTLLVGSFKIMGSKPKPPPPTTVTVSRGVVLASVNATGNVTVSDQLALDFPVGGKLVCCDVSEEWTSIGRRYWKEAGLDDRIELTIGPGIKTLDWLLAQGLTGQLDMAFIDANKNDYDSYYERCLKLLRRGGVILIDNVLWGGRVVDPAKTDEDTLAIRALNAKLRTDQRVDLSGFCFPEGGDDETLLESVDIGHVILR